MQNWRGRSRGQATGFTLLELLIVLAIIAIAAGIVVMSGRPIVSGQEDASAVRSVQQSVWQGATMAASRGVRTLLIYSGGNLDVLNDETGALIRRFELPDRGSLNVPEGTILEFTPPGKVDETSLGGLPSPFELDVNGRITRLQVSLIGEVRVVGGS